MNEFYTIRKRIPVTYDEVSKQFCVGNSKQQRLLLETLAQDIEATMGKNGDWAMQCYSIARDAGWLPLNKDRFIDQLETLVDELKASKEETK